ncbi:DNA oxidative demethylase AlkB [Viridibacterium curvum]|uniref:DNA oxidative demethylase AlkB n=1 Tax=Viridibacterium curvum TaxID=1101404 RepID=A0ABP9Q7W8_9RHOO
MTGDLFAALPPQRHDEAIAPGAMLLHAFALEQADALLSLIFAVTQAAPLRLMQTPGGYSMSVAMSNCGKAGWVSDSHGYRYATHDPLSNTAWPAMPALFQQLAQDAAHAAGFVDFMPDACLINRYAPGARMSLHQDRNERDMAAPIVSVSLGVPATFLFGGLTRSQRPARHRLQHGDVIVWGGPSRLAFHGVAPVAHQHHPATGEFRYNLTFRKAR